MPALLVVDQRAQAECIGHGGKLFVNAGQRVKRDDVRRDLNHFVLIDTNLTFNVERLTEA